MSVALIFLSLGAICLSIFGWLWLCAGFRSGGWRGIAGLAALQVSGFCLVYGLLRGQVMAGIFQAALPPLALVGPDSPLIFIQLIDRLIAPFALWGIVVLGLALALRPLRPFAPGLAVLAGMIGALWSADGISQKAMCAAAAARGFSQFQRYGFMAEMAGDHAGPGFVHALAQSGEKGFAWSYREMNWYELPAGLNVKSPDLAVRCKG